MNYRELQQKLNELKKQVRQRIPEQSKVIQRSVDELKEKKLKEKGLQTGDRAPDFTLQNCNPFVEGHKVEDFQLPNIEGKMVSLNSLLKKGSVVINFYRGGWCPYCNLELRALVRALPEMKKRGASLVAISPEAPKNMYETVQKEKLDFEVLSDVDNKVGKLFQIVFEIPQYLKKVYEGFGLDLSIHNQTDKFELPIPATYIITPNREIVFAFINEDFTIRANIEDILATLEKNK